MKYDWLDAYLMAKKGVQKDFNAECEKPPTWSAVFRYNGSSLESACLK